MRISKDDLQELTRANHFSRVHLVIQKSFVATMPNNYVSEGIDQIWDKELWHTIIHPFQITSKMRRIVHDVIELVGNRDGKSTILKFKILLKF